MWSGDHSARRRGRSRRRPEAEADLRTDTQPTARGPGRGGVARDVEPATPAPRPRFGNRKTPPAVWVLTADWVGLPHPVNLTRRLAARRRPLQRPPRPESCSPGLRALRPGLPKEPEWSEAGERVRVYRLRLFHAPGTTPGTPTNGTRNSSVSSMLVITTQHSAAECTLARWLVGGHRAARAPAGF
jgi:hypothetical protein